MAYPLVMARVGTALASATPSVIARVSTYVSKASGTVVSGAADLTKWAKSSPAAAILVATGLIEAGTSVTELFGVDEQKIASNPLTAALITELRAAQVRALAVIDGQADIKLEIGNEGDLELLKNLVRYLEGKYFSAAKIMEAHTFDRMFQELSTDQLQRGLRLFGNGR